MIIYENMKWAMSHTEILGKNLSYWMNDPLLIYSLGECKNEPGIL